MYRPDQPPSRFISRTQKPIASLATTSFNRSYPVSRGLVAGWLHNNGAIPDNNTHRVVKEIFDTRLNGLFANTTAQTGNDPDWTPSRFGMGLFFNSSNGEFYQVPSNPKLNFTTTMSLSTWLTTSTLVTSGGSHYAVAKWISPASGQAWAFGLYDGANPATDMIFFWNNPTPTFSAVVSTGMNLAVDTWYHMVVTFENGNVLFYKNGELMGTSVVVAATSSIQVTNSALVMGRVDGSQPWGGMIDNVLLWNRALTQGEVRQLYTDPWAMFRPSAAQMAYLYKDPNQTASVVYAPTRMMSGFGF